MEISDLMASARRRRKHDVKQQLIVLFAAAESTAEHIGLYLNKDNMARALWDFFPKLFAEEKEAYEKAEFAQELERAKANRKAYAAELKRRREMGLL